MLFNSSPFLRGFNDGLGRHYMDTFDVSVSNILLLNCSLHYRFSLDLPVIYTYRSLVKSIRNLQLICYIKKLGTKSLQSIPFERKHPAKNLSP